MSGRARADSAHVHGIDTASGSPRLARAMAVYRHGLADGLAPSVAIVAAYRSWTESLVWGIVDSGAIADSEPMIEQSKPHGAPDTAPADPPVSRARLASGAARFTLLDDRGRADNGAAGTPTLRAPLIPVHASAVHGATSPIGDNGAPAHVERTLDRSEDRWRLMSSAPVAPDLLDHSAQAAISRRTGATGASCSTCGASLNPVAATVYGPAGPCRDCTRRAHRAAVGGPA